MKTSIPLPLIMISLVIIDSCSCSWVSSVEQVIGSNSDDFWDENGVLLTSKTVSSSFQCKKQPKDCTWRQKYVPETCSCVCKDPEAQDKCNGEERAWIQSICFCGYLPI